MLERMTAVVVAYRSAAQLPSLLRALLAQGVDEVVVVDNASPDDSGVVARDAAQGAARGRITVLESRVNRGFAGGVNLGVAAAGGDLLLLINPDVVLHAGAVDALRAASRRHPGAVLGPVVRDPAGRLLPTRRSLPSLRSLLGEEVLVPERARPGRLPQRLWARWRGYDVEEDAPLLAGVCLLVPRAVWEATGPLDEGYFLYWEEVDWQLRARALGHPTILVPAARITHARSSSLGLHDEQRARLLAAATRRFTDLHLPGRRGAAARGLLAWGQALRWASWSMPPLRGRPTALARRRQHAAWLRAMAAGRPR